MLINNHKTSVCIYCGRLTTLISTNTQQSVCEYNCEDNIWVKEGNRPSNPIGEHNEYVFG